MICTEMYSLLYCINLVYRHINVSPARKLVFSRLSDFHLGRLPAIRDWIHRLLVINREIRETKKNPSFIRD